MKTIRLADKWNYFVIAANDLFAFPFHRLHESNKLLSQMELPVPSMTKKIPVHQHRHSNFEPHRLIVPLPLILSLEDLFDCLFTSYKQQPITIDSMSLFRLSASTISTQWSRKSKTLPSVALLNEPCAAASMRRLHNAHTHTHTTLCLTRLVWSNI